MKKVLYVTSRPRDLRALAAGVRGQWSVASVSEPSQAPAELALCRYDLLLLDFALTGAYAPALLRQIASIPRHPPLFILSRELCPDFVRFAIANGAAGYFRLPCDFAVLARSIGRLCASDQDGSDCDSRPDGAGASCAREAVPTNLSRTILGNSPLMRQLRAKILQLAPLKEPVFIRGESGSGKELVASMLHAHSTVSGGAYRAFNVSCIPPTLAESLLFGNVRGSYTDARDAPGLFKEVDGGTLFLDEIGELDASLQPKFLRVLEDQHVYPLGSRIPVVVSFRLVCATNRDLEAAVASGAFRQDLLQRIDVLRIDVPPLREHPEDIPELIASILQKKGKILASSSLDKLFSHSWPGNVRQLFNCLVRAVSLSSGDVIYPDLISF